ncbi:MAG: DUF3881 family protein [Lachnospiraceae bacterium]|nr:DUF3881 family protein [Lachnospiraceae bacterium]MBQ4282458.1 DUF3881 family protein [Lachnospira sp.]
MNLFIRTLGFPDMDSKEEKKFIQAGIKQCLDAGFVLKQEMFKRGVIIVRVSPSTGVYIYGRYEGKKFVYEYYFPFVVGSRITDNEEITLERHVDKESYAVICDEIKTGVTLIFFLQNVCDYMDYVAGIKDFKPEMFLPDRKNALSKEPLKNKKTILTALSLGGMILLPIAKPGKDSQVRRDAEDKRRKLIAAAKSGDEDAIESLTLKDIDTYTSISQRILYEDVFTIVDSTFMPCGVECDQYSVIGEILDLEEEINVYTHEKIYIMSLNCNDIVFTMAIAARDLLGEPKIGRRFKGQIWLQGHVRFKD